MSSLVSSFEKKMSVGFADSEKKIVEIPLDKICPDKEQVRTIFDEDKLAELADSIKERGVLNPIHVRAEGDGYIIITGERRYRASQLAGRNTIPCIIYGYITEKDIKALQLIENLQREELSAIETAKGFKALMEKGLNQRQIATSLGISEGTVSRFLALVNPKKLPGEWLATIEKHYSRAPLTELYELATADKKRKPQLFKKLLEKVQKDVEIEAYEVEKKGDEEKDTKSDFSDEELLKAWEILVREKRKNIQNLLHYVTAKKIIALLELTEDIDK
jgi:ParB family chromosome partitioning protein